VAYFHLNPLVPLFCIASAVLIVDIINWIRLGHLIQKILPLGLKKDNKLGEHLRSLYKGSEMISSIYGEKISTGVLK
jgi:hypothetical protein